MDEDVSYTEEFEAIVELIIGIIFMSFCVFATAFMVKTIAPRTSISYGSDKLTTLSSYNVKDPMYFTGYQAYMFSWHMDTISEEPVMWLATDTTMHNPGLGNDADADNCATGDEHVIISVRDMDTGEFRNSFINWRNRHITGSLLSSGQPSVQSVVNKCTDFFSISQPRYLWSGTSSASNCRFHLEYSNSNMEASDYTGRKDSIWQLTPVHTD